MMQVIKREFVVLAAILLSLIGLVHYIERRGRDKQVLDVLYKQLNQERKANGSVAKERASTVGADNPTLLKRLRSRDDKWGGV